MAEQTQAQVIEKKNWQTFCDNVSKTLRGGQSELELASLDIGDQIEQNWTPFEGISYDPNDDALYVHTPDLDHAIQHPQMLTVDQSGGRIRSISIKDSANQLQTIRLKEPLLLEAPRGEATKKGPKSEARH